MALSRGVFAVLVAASLGLAAAPGARAADPDEIAGGRNAGTPEAWGTALPTYLVVGASELSPRNSSVGVGCIQSCQLRYSTSAVPEPFYAPIHIPSGALLTYLELDYYDVTAAGQAWVSLGICDPSAEGCSGFSGPCSNGALACSGDAAGSGFFVDQEDITPYGIVIDNAHSRYVISAGNSTTDGTTAISQIIIGYVRQVSPPPASATFADVPTSHPLFQFIEALVASGTTAGCGGGNYCPNAPLTRGQMAVFLAKALGLQWN